MLRNTFVTALTLTLSSIGYAGTMGSACAPGDVTIPCAMKQWDIGISALYLKPVYSTDNHFRAAEPFHLNDIDNKWDWGYQLTGSYHFNTGNDLTLDWTHYDVTAKNNSFHVRQSNQFDQANFVFGQQVNFGTLYSARFFGGLQYAKISAEHIQNNLIVQQISFNQINHADFNGVGPIFGIDFAYSIGHGLSITSNTATSVIYGTSRGNINTAAGGIVVTATPYTSSKLVVPGLEEKLGINYQYQFAQGLLTLDGGYQALNYFHVLNRLPMTGVINSDFGLFGPYFGVRWLGLS